MRLIQKTILLLFHPSLFFSSKKKEGMFKSLILLIFCSLVIGLSNIWLNVILIYSNSYLSPFEAILQLLPLTIYSQFPGITMYIICILGMAFLVDVIIHLFGGRDSLQKTILVFCYAQTPIALLIIFNSIFIWIFFPILSMLQISMFMPLLLPCLFLLGLFWMINITLHGLSKFRITSASIHYYIDIFIILLIGVIFMYFSLYLTAIGISPHSLSGNENQIKTETVVFNTSDPNLSLYANDMMGIHFLFPSVWELSTIKSKGRLDTESVSVSSINHLGYNLSSGPIINISPCNFHHYPMPFSAYASSDLSVPFEDIISYSITVFKSEGYSLENQSSITINNKTGKVIHLKKVPQYMKSGYSNQQPCTAKEDLNNTEILDIIFVQVNGLMYDFMMRTYAADVDEYQKYYNIILQSIQFKPGTLKSI